VIGGELVTALAEHGARLLPVDSEHSALFQLIQLGAAGTVERLVCHAIGGPFRERPYGRVTPEEALAHPTWIWADTVDCATLDEQGLRVIGRTIFSGPV